MNWGVVKRIYLDEEESSLLGQVGNQYDNQTEHRKVLEVARWICVEEDKMNWGSSEKDLSR